MHVAEVQTLRWMCGCTLSDKIRNGGYQEMVRVAYVAGKTRESGRGRLTKYWGEVLDKTCRIFMFPET
ncbi:hypothetical protein H5410_020453 [Solanum commersonii]|uniref:Uncharacterized protein n=1 Tax=Solanum commersonii TaxID=4109 RepID=A0A9J5ZCG3_SOLCO|nr:hypothetical protein H5410_020453 [Solanum commersonii]